MSDLWPSDIAAGDDLLPVTPVMEQAELLAKHTANLVKAEVKPVASEDNTFAFDFDLVVKVLEYRFTLFSLEYGVEGFPAVLIPYSKIASELGIKPKPHGMRYIPLVEAKDKMELLKHLEAILRSGTTRSILQTLVAQAQKFKR